MVAENAKDPFRAGVAELSMLTTYMERQAQASLGPRTSLVAQATSYVLSASGKLLRPRLMLDACQAVGGDPGRVFPAAAGTEFGHIASLIHDDIIDHDQERRGQQAIHARFGVPMAILTGDLFIFQMFLSYCRCADSGVSAERVLCAIQLLASTCIEVCRGQELEARMQGDVSCSEELYLEMIRLKTASVCRSAAEIGALLGGASDDTIAHLRVFGEHLGLAFQIADDVLSYEGHEARLGKPVASDLRNGRITLPVIYALKSSRAASRQRITFLLRNGASAGDAGVTELAGLLYESRGLERARARAARLVDQAGAHLDHLPLSDARERLRALATHALQRDC